MSDLQELWNSDREQLRQVRELLRKSEARVAELEEKLYGTQQARDQYTEWHAKARDEANDRRDRMAQARAKLENALTYLSDKEDVESTPLRAIGHAKTEITRALEILR